MGTAVRTFIPFLSLGYIIGRCMLTSPLISDKNVWNESMRKKKLFLLLEKGFFWLHSHFGEITKSTSGDNHLLLLY